MTKCSCKMINAMLFILTQNLKFFFFNLILRLWGAVVGHHWLKYVEV